MSLVAYESSGDSDSEDTSSSVVPDSKPSGGLFSHLPAPKTATSGALGNGGPSKEINVKSNVPIRDMSNDDLDSQPTKGGLLSSLPKPKKRTEPVKITIPQIERPNVSDELFQ